MTIFTVKITNLNNINICLQASKSDADRNINPSIVPITASEAAPAPATPADD